MKQVRLVIAAAGEESVGELIKLRKKITSWRVKHGDNKPLTMLEWATEAQKRLEK